MAIIDLSKWQWQDQDVDDKVSRTIGTARSELWHNTRAHILLNQEYHSAKLAILDLAKVNLPGINAALLLTQLEESYQHAVRAVESAVPIRLSLTPPLPPKLDRSKVKGVVAYRAWKMSEGGYLSPAIRTTSGVWKEVMFADEIPKMGSSHGLHATRLPYYETNNYGDSYCGIVDLYGRVVEHADSVLRAECARIMCIIVDISNNDDIVRMATGTYEMLRKAYPNVQVYLMTDWQKRLYLMREILISAGVDLT